MVTATEQGGAPCPRSPQPAVRDRSGLPARGRRYGDEDIFLTSRLRAEFDIALCHPLDAVALMDRFDAVVVRNSGPVLHYQREYDAFRDRAAARGTLVYNPLTGRADMVGKQYLSDLTEAGYPVIPTVDRPEDLGRLPEARRTSRRPRPRCRTTSGCLTGHRPWRGAARPGWRS
jgi:hypothetical protein